MRTPAAIAVLVCAGGCSQAVIDTLDPPGTCVARADVPAIAARSSAAFVDSVGLRVSLAPETLDRTVAGLVSLGVRHVTETVHADAAAVRALARADISAEIAVEPGTDPVAFARARTPSLEAVGAWDTLAWSADWAARLRGFVADTRRALQADASAAALPFVGPVVSEPAKLDAIGELASLVDYGAFDPWPTRNDEAPGRSLDANLAIARRIYGTRPIMALQTGYSTPPGGLSERVQAKYLLRLLVEHFARGIVRTYVTALDGMGAPDDPFSANLGLRRADGREKPAYAAIQRLLATLEDPSPDAVLGSLRVRVNASATPVRSLLLQKAGGVFVLALWRDVDSGDADVSETVAIDVGTPIAGARLFRPDAGGGAAAQFAPAAALEVPLTDGLNLLELVTSCPP